MQKPIERLSNITSEQFKQLYMLGNKPVIITDGIDNWQASSLWSPDYLLKNYGDEVMQLYDDLFNLLGFITLRDYIVQYFGQIDTDNKNIPYIRWYTSLKNYDFEWADHFFDKIKHQWNMPYFLPSKNYLLPHNSKNGISNPNIDMFPAKGLFISGKGARTRLHYDPWCSDAILCQIYGKKKITIYEPILKKYLTNGTDIVDVDKPDYDKFPNFKKVEPTFTDVLSAGEIVFFPHNWLHHVSTIEDSISLTWNFVHITTWPDFFNYLIANPNTQDLEVIKFFLNKNNN